MTIKAVMFDLDDTLLWDDRSVAESFQATCEEAAKHYAIDPKQLEEKVKEEARALYATYETFPFTQNIGINPFEGLWANFNDDHDENFKKLNQIAPQYRTESWTRGLLALGIDDPKLGYALGERFHAERRQRPHVYEDTFKVLDALKGKYRLLLLTNGSPDLQQEKLAGVPELAPYFDHIMISGSFGQGKPSPELFKHCLSLLDIEPSEGVMVGDKLTTDIKGALNIGMTSVWINRHEVQRNDEIVPKHEIRSLEELLDLLEKLS